MALQTPKDINELYSYANEANNQWKSVYDKLPSMKGNLIADLREGKITEIAGTGIKTRAVQNDGGFNQIAVMRPDGTEEIINSVGSKNIITSEIVRAGLGLPKGIGMIEGSQGSDYNYRQLADAFGIPFMTQTQLENSNSKPLMTEAERAAQRQASGVDYGQSVQTASRPDQPSYGQPITNSSGQVISPDDPNYSEYAKQQGMSKENNNQVDQLSSISQSTGIDPTVLAKDGISGLIASGRPFSETDAKNFAYASGDSNWQQYVGGVGGQKNPLYIGSTNWANLQKTYTPYQLEKATIRTKDGIFWNPNINIAEVPRTDPVTQINNDAATIANIVSDAKSSADKFTKKTDIGKTSDTLPETPEDTMMEMLNGLYADTAESLYNELYNTQEIQSAKADVLEYKQQLDEYEDQIDELKNDIRREVEGEASESYISALATVRGGNILKLQKQAQRGYETALSILTNARSEANALLQVKMNDNNTRYNRMFQMLQLQIQQEGTQFNQQLALLSAAQQIPEGRSVTLPDGSTIKGMKENDNLNVVQFTDASKKTYVIGVDKKTGEELYRTFIGNAPSSGGSAQTAVQQLAEYQATQELKYQKEMDALIESGDVDISYDEKGNPFYYDKKAMEEYNSNRNWWVGKKDPIDFKK